MARRRQGASVESRCLNEGHPDTHGYSVKGALCALCVFVAAAHRSPPRCTATRRTRCRAARRHAADMLPTRAVGRREWRTRTPHGKDVRHRASHIPMSQKSETRKVHHACTRRGRRLRHLVSMQISARRVHHFRALTRLAMGANTHTTSPNYDTHHGLVTCGKCARRLSAARRPRRQWK